MFLNKDSIDTVLEVFKIKEKELQVAFLQLFFNIINSENFCSFKIFLEKIFYLLYLKSKEDINFYFPENKKWLICISGSLIEKHKEMGENYVIYTKLSFIVVVILFSHFY